MSQGCGEPSPWLSCPRTWPLACLPLSTGRVGFPRRDHKRGFVYGNAKGMLMGLTREPLSAPSGSLCSQEPLPLQEPPRTWISLNTMEIKHFLIICKIWTLEGPRQWFSECSPGSSSFGSIWEHTGHARAADSVCWRPGGVPLSCRSKDRSTRGGISQLQGMAGQYHGSSGDHVVMRRP